MEVSGKSFRLIACFLVGSAFFAFPCYGGSKVMEPIQLSLSPPVSGLEKKGWQESEHRPVRIRRYWLSEAGALRRLEACVLRPDGSVTEADLRKEGVWVSVSFKTPFGDGPMHGVHNVYVMDKRVVEGELIVRVGKWLTIHHNCGWGHKHKYDKERIKAKSLKSIPFEVTCEGLWDGNFHSNVSSGDRLKVKVLSHFQSFLG